MFERMGNFAGLPRIGRNIAAFLVVFGGVLVLLLFILSLWIFRQTLFPILLGLLFLLVILLCASKLFKALALKRMLRLVQADPVNPDVHFRLAWALFNRNVAGPSANDRLEALAAFRNAIQLDLCLDIGQPETAIRRFRRRSLRARRKEEFIVLLSYLAAIDFLFDEFERRGIEGIGGEIAARKRDLLATPVYELDDRLEFLGRIVRDLALAYREQNPEPWLESLPQKPADSTYTARKSLEALLEFHEELLRLMRELVRSLGRIG